MIDVLPIAKGLATLIPGVMRMRKAHTGGTDSARYCYSVWLRHLMLIHEHSGAALPRSFIELGPGDSLGTGFAGLLSGAEHYEALDAIRYADASVNVKIFDEMVALFKRRAPIPDDQEFPQVWPALCGYQFPTHLLSDSLLRQTLAPKRLRQIRSEAAGAGHTPGRYVNYRAPWSPSDLVSEPVDLVLSQAVLQTVEDLPGTYARISDMLRPGGLQSHTVGFGNWCTRKWNGQWEYPAWLWKLVHGKRAWLINRAPDSVHQALLGRHNGELLFATRRTDHQGIGRNRLAREWRHLTNDDLATQAAYYIARKR